MASVDQLVVMETREIPVMQVTLVYLVQLVSVLVAGH